MRPIIRSLGIDRRTLLSSLAVPAAAAFVPASTRAQTTTTGDPLPSWNDGPAKQAIIAFVRETTDQASPRFVPSAQRIAEFDQDGTLWVEHPLYTQVVYCLDRVGVVVKEKPELKDREPFKTVLTGDRDAIAKLSMRDIFEIVLVTQSGLQSRREKLAGDRQASSLEPTVH
jgi:hypothetical protein